MKGKKIYNKNENLCNDRVHISSKSCINTCEGPHILLLFIDENKCKKKLPTTTRQWKWRKKMKNDK
mgnify:CR=1 FL=1